MSWNEQVTIVFFLTLLFILIGYAIGSILFASLLAKIKKTDFRKIGSGNMGATNVLRVHGKKWGLVVFILDYWKSLVAIFISMAIYWSMKDVLTTNNLFQEAGFIIYLAGIGTVLGHCFPFLWVFCKVFYRKDPEKAKQYTGGKGASCMAGLFTAISPVLFAIGFCLFWIIIFISRYVSLASVLSISILALLVLVPNINMYYMVDFPGFDNPAIIGQNGLESFSNNLTIDFSNNQWYLFTMFATAFFSTLIIIYKHKVNLLNIYHKTERKANFIWHKKASSTTKEK